MGLHEEISITPCVFTDSARNRNRCVSLSWESSFCRMPYPWPLSVTCDVHIETSFINKNNFFFQNPYSRIPSSFPLHTLQICRVSIAFLLAGNLSIIVKLSTQTSVVSLWNADLLILRSIYSFFHWIFDYLRIYIVAVGYSSMSFTIWTLLSTN
jgi:hypothetical protein